MIIISPLHHFGSIQIMSELLVTILMPCLNEAETLAFCVRQAVAALRDNNIAGEVVVADNGSTDGSQKIATDEGACVVPVPIRGYGAALMAGIELVMGNRFSGEIKPGAMPPLHKYLGNPVLSFIGRLFFRIPVRDFHCG